MEIRTVFDKDPELKVLRDQAIDRLKEAYDLPPARLTYQVDLAEKAVVQLRDILIERFRDIQKPSEGKEFGKILEQVNLALSFITGIEYPAAGIRRSGIEETKKILEKLESD